MAMGLSAQCAIGLGLQMTTANIGKCIMGMRIQKILEDERRKQPIAELERKWNKARGRHSKQFWAVEWIDLAYARATELSKELGWK